MYFPHNYPGAIRADMFFLNESFNTKHTESKDKKETRNITRIKEKEIGVATVSFIQLRDIICSSCSVICFLCNLQMLLVAQYKLLQN